MKSYDDLQRFKDKTRTGAIGFKDMSAQNQRVNPSSWAIIKQLAGNEDDSVLAQAGSIAVPVPQAVKPGEFDAAFANPAPAQHIAPAAQSSVADGPAAARTVEKAAALPLPEEKAAAISLFEQLAPAPAAVVPAAPVPAPEPVKQSVAPTKAEPVRFEQLFAAKGATTTNHPAKDLPLQPLLEMIASCR
ncbi:cellulose biosynthesis protein BcsO [Dryocola sp. BD613]|uniref:cellulose biosynthesis protein BcsO n=1 Tax=Dryocola sp. BD613 TaxID=3133272 RepID=UPI003F503633